MLYSRLFLIMLLTSCGQIPSHYIDPQFIQYIQQFQRDATIHQASHNFDNVRQIMFTHDLPADEDGECISYTQTYFDYATMRIESLDYDEIHISPRSWEVMDDSVRLGLLYHELGHCLYNFQHSANPQSIMFYQSHYFSDWQQAVDEFFKAVKE